MQFSAYDVLAAAPGFMAVRLDHSAGFHVHVRTVQESSLRGSGPHPMLCAGRALNAALFFTHGWTARGAVGDRPLFLAWGQGDRRQPGAFGWKKSGVRQPQTCNEGGPLPPSQPPAIVAVRIFMCLIPVAKQLEA